MSSKYPAVCLKRAAASAMRYVCIHTCMHACTCSMWIAVHAIKYACMMSACMYRHVCMYVYVHTHQYIHIDASDHRTYIFKIYVLSNTHIHTYTHKVLMSTLFYHESQDTYLHSVCTYTYTCTHVYTYTHIHTCTHKVIMSTLLLSQDTYHAIYVLTHTHIHTCTHKVIMSTLLLSQDIDSSKEIASVMMRLVCSK